MECLNENSNASAQWAFGCFYICKENVKSFDALFLFISNGNIPMDLGLETNKWCAWIYNDMASEPMNPSVIMRGNTAIYRWYNAWSVCLNITSVIHLSFCYNVSSFTIYLLLLCTAGIKILSLYCCNIFLFFFYQGICFFVMAKFKET